MPSKYFSNVHSKRENKIKSDRKNERELSVCVVLFFLLLFTLCWCCRDPCRCVVLYKSKLQAASANPKKCDMKSWKQIKRNTNSKYVDDVQFKWESLEFRTLNFVAAMRKARSTRLEFTIWTHLRWRVLNVRLKIKRENNEKYVC